METSPHNLHLDLSDSNQMQGSSGDQERLIEPQHKQDNDFSPSKFENVPLSTPSDDGMSAGTPIMTREETTWLMSFWEYLLSLAAGTLSVIDYLGQRFAWFFGITSPKYQYVIDEVERLKRLEEEERLQELKERQAELTAIAVHASDTLQQEAERQSERADIANSSTAAIS